jgi:hypothetical protein
LAPLARRICGQSTMRAAAQCNHLTDKKRNKSRRIATALK